MPRLSPSGHGFAPTFGIAPCLVQSSGNHYNVRIIPNGTTGFNNVQNLNATFYQQPRVYQWTNTVRF